MIYLETGYLIENFVMVFNHKYDGSAKTWEIL